MSEANDAPRSGADESGFDQSAATSGEAGQEVPRDPVVTQSLGRVSVVHSESGLLGSGHSGLYDAVFYTDYPALRAARTAA